MTTRQRITILLLAIAVVAITLLGCDTGTEWGEWQEDVSERQRQPGQPVTVETPEMAERTE